MGKTEVVFLIGSNKLQKLGVHFVILLLNGMRFLSPIDLGTSWELALTDINTKFLSCFFLGLRYIDLSISTKYNEYHSLMKYLTKTGITLLDLIDFRDAVFFDQLNSIKTTQIFDPVPKRKAKTNQVFVELPKLFAVKKVFHSFSCAEQLCFGMMWAVKQSAFLT